MAVELWSANHVSAPPEATFTAPSVHDLPAGTVGAEVGLAETPRQSLSGVEVHGMFFASSIFWLARNVAVDVWLPPWTADVEYGITESSATKAIVMMTAASSTSASVNPASDRRTLPFGDMCGIVCNAGALPQDAFRYVELPLVTAGGADGGGPIYATPSDKKNARTPRCPEGVSTRREIPGNV